MIPSVSNATISLVSRASSSRLQSLLLKAQTELSSGRQADIGLALGARTASVVALRSEIGAGEAFLTSNALVKSRLTATDSALSNLTGIAQSLQEALAESSWSAEAVRAIEAQAGSALDQIVSIANSSFAGAYLFQGMGAGGKPLNDIAFESANGPGAELRSRFIASFGASPGDDVNASISRPDMKSFLDQGLSNLFEPAQWSTFWSNATEKSDQVRIDDGVSIEFRATASSQAIRDLVKSLTMLAGLGVSALGSDARAEVLGQATEILGRSTTGLIRLSAGIGMAVKSVEASSGAIEIRKNQLQARLSDLESVDPAEVSLRLSALSTQLQASYQTTAMLSKLSLIDFI